MTTQVLQGDCREAMKGLADNSVESCVTDPPYELGLGIISRFFNQPQRETRMEKRQQRRITLNVGIEVIRGTHSHARGTKMNFDQFVTESNRIERIVRPPTKEEVDATKRFVTMDSRPTLDLLCALANIYAPDKGFLRNQRGMDVRVGNHIAPRGGPQIYRELERLLATIEEVEPFNFHVAYETLHPFMDGNGRTGRALWAWQMWRENQSLLDLGFLHAWYYQTLSAVRRGGEIT